MKKWFLPIAFLLNVLTIDAQGIEFFHGTFAEALEKAKKEQKLIFMDAYAEWCGPCKQMAAKVFTDQKVGQFFNANFVNLKMDMEKGEGPSLRGKLNVSAYPSLFFLNEKGDVVHKMIGAMQADPFIALGKTALGKTDNSKEFEKAYNEGKRDPDLILNYVKALNRAGKPSLKVVNEFLMKADMTQATTLKVIFEGTTQSDSKVFDLLIKHKALITGLYSEQQVNSKIEEAIGKTLDNAVEFKSAELHKEAKDKMKMHLPAKAEEFALDADMKFYKASNNVKDYCKACETLIKKEGKPDARKLYTVGKGMLDAFPYEKAAIVEAEKYLKKAAENGGLCEYYYWYAHALMRNGKNKDASVAAEKALKIAKESAPNLVPASEKLLEDIKQKG